MKKITDKSYIDIASSKGYVIFDFSSPGCAPCKKVPPMIKEIVRDNTEFNIEAFEIDVVENPEAAQYYFVLGVPTLIIFKDGKELKRFNSVPSKKKVLKVFEK